jgi:hypothetical protein
MSTSTLNVSGNLDISGSITVKNSVTMMTIQANDDATMTIQGDDGAKMTIQGDDLHITGSTTENGGLRIKSVYGNVLINNNRNEDGNPSSKDVHFNTESDISNVYIDHGSLLIGYGDNFLKLPTAALDVSGSIQFTGTCSLGSDYRLKSDVANLSEQPEMTTMKLRPVSYTMKNKPCFGFIAHELQEHFHQLVTGTKDGENYQTVNYIGLIAVLVKDIQAQQKQIESMKQDIDALQKSAINPKS